MSSQKNIVRASITGCLLAMLLVGRMVGAEPAASSGSKVLLDFEEDSQFAQLRLTKYTAVEPSSESSHDGKRAAKIVYSAVPEGERAYPAVILGNEGLTTRDFSPFEAISLWVMNPGTEDAELSLSIWDKAGNRSFPIPSTVTIKPGVWQQIVARLVLHGLDSKQIGSIHFYQKVNRRPLTLIIDDVQLLSPYAGRFAAKIQLARENLSRARTNAQAIGAEEHIAPKTIALAKRLEQLEGPSSSSNKASQKSQHLLELAQITTESQELVNAIVTRSGGKDVRLTGPQVTANWLSDQEKVRLINSLRLMDTPLRDEVFQYLEPASELQTLVIGSHGITGAGLEKLSTSKLTRLSMRNTGAQDNVFEHIAKFPQLQSIELQETSVTSRIFKYFQGLEQLKSLSLSDTLISDADFSAIAKLGKLEGLDLDRTKISGESLQHLENLSNLKSLNLSGTEIHDEGLSHLGKLYRLESLVLEQTPIRGSGFGKLSALDNLITLNLSNTQVGDSALRQLGELPKLKRLELSSTRITDGTVQQVAQSAKLDYLDLYGTNITDAGLAHLQGQRGLQQLYLGGTQASDIGISYLKQAKRLRQLDLAGTRITDAALESLREMPDLDTLMLGNTRITGPGLVHLAGLSKLRNLDLSGTSVTDDAIASLAGLANLRTLNLSGTRVTSNCIKHLQGAGRLIDLHLEATDFGDEGLELLTGLPSLQLLNLNETAVTDAGLKHLKKLERLLVLSLNHTKITDEGLAQLGDHFIDLQFTHTRITDQGVEYLQRNDQLLNLRLASTGITNDALKMLQAIPNLKQLDLAETNVTDAGLAHLTALPDLQELNLDGTSISDLGIDSLLGLASLQRVSLENSRVTSNGVSYLRHRSPELQLNLVFPWTWGERWSYYSLPAGQESTARSTTDKLAAELKSLTSLGYLHVGDSMLTAEILRSLKDLPTLEHLSFQGSSVTDEMLAHLLGLSQVARLDLANTPITDGGLIHLKDMQGLRELTLQGNKITGTGLMHLAGLTRLQELNLRDTDLDDEGLSHVAKLQQLRKLQLTNTKLTDKGIQHLLQIPKLQYLDLYGTEVTDAALSRLKQMKSLRYCYLSHTGITDRGIEHLRDLPDLEELALDGTELTDQGVAVLRSLPNLRRLRIGHTQVTDAGLPHVASLANLVQLELGHLDVTNDGISTLQPLAKLQSLDLSGTNITDPSLDQLAKFPALSELNVQDTTLSEQSVSRLQNEHPKLTVISGITTAGYSLWSLIITVVYGIAVVAICLYGIHRYWLVWLFLRDRNVRTSPEPMEVFRELPKVSVQLPMFNERGVAQRIIEATCALDYPRDRLQIQVLDDSTDDSANIVRRCCEQMAAAGHPVELLHRSQRDGFKGGALAAGLKSATGELIAVFDADFVPPPDILQRTIHHFSDPKVGMVQAEWSHLNRHQSLLTECQAMFLDGHFIVEQSTRSRNQRWFNFNGTAGVWRRDCIESAGGWEHDTLTEDTDLSYRAQLKGWKFLYLPTVRCDAELPSTMTAFLGQQHRWTKGLIQTAKKLLPRILCSSAPWKVKIEAWFHLTSPLMYLVMFIVTGIALPALFLTTPLEHRETLALALGLATLGMGTLAAATFYMVSQRAQGYGFVRTLFKLPLLMALGIGMCAVNARAVLEAILGWNSPFVRTPKFGGRADFDPDPAVSKRRWRISGAFELVIAGLLLACLVLSFLRPYTLIGAPFLLLFAMGYGEVGVLSLLDLFSLRRTKSHRTTEPWLKPSRVRFALGSLAVLMVIGISFATLMIASPLKARSRNDVHEPISFGLDLTTGDWKIVGGRQSPEQTNGAIKRVYVDRGSLVLNIQLDEQSDEGEIMLDLDGPLQALGESLGAGRPLAFDLEYPARFTGEFQAFVKDGENKSEYGSMEFIESHDFRRAVTVSLVPSLRVPPMGYQDVGFDPALGIRRIGLKVSAQSDRVRGAGYRPFRGTLRVAKVRVGERDFAANPEPEIRPSAPDRVRQLPPVMADQFLAASGVNRPWPVGYGFSGPVSADQIAELERTYSAIANCGCKFTRIYVGDYRTGLLFDGKGKISGVEPAFLEYLDRLAEIANRHGITVMISLTDNTMVDGRGLESVGFIRDGEESDLFVSKVLSEFVKKLHTRQVVWDIFNEPENVTALPLRDVQRYVDRVVAAVKRADGDARVTVVSRSRPEIVYWQGRGLDLYSHNIFTRRSFDEALAATPTLDAPIMVAEIAPEFAAEEHLKGLREAGYSGVGIWGWNTDDKYAWNAADLARIVEPLVAGTESEVASEEGIQ